MADDCLDPYEYRLYGHYVRVCGEHGGACDEVLRDTAAACHMSLGKAFSTRAALNHAGYITVTSAGQVAITDRWQENALRYTARSSGEQKPAKPVHDVNKTHELRSPHEHLVHVVNKTADARKKDKLDKEKDKREGADAPTPRKASKSKIERAKENAYVLAFVEAFPDGYKPPITASMLDYAGPLKDAGYTPEQLANLVRSKLSGPKPHYAYKIRYALEDMSGHLMQQARLKPLPVSKPAVPPPSQDAPLPSWLQTAPVGGTR